MAIGTAAAALGGLGALGGLLGGRSERRAAEAANRPQVTTFDQTTSDNSSFSPWNITHGSFERAVGAANRDFGRRMRGFQQGIRPPSTAGYYGSIPGSSGLSNSLIQAMADRAMGGSPGLEAAGVFATDVLGGNSQNPFLDQAFAQASGMGDAGGNLQRFMDMGFGGGFNPGAGGMQDFVNRMMSESFDPQGPPADPFSRGRSSRSYGGGGGVANFQGGGGVGGNGLFDTEAAKILGGEYLEGNPFLDEVLARITEQSNEAHGARMAGLDSRASGAGRYGSSFYQNQRRLADAEQADALAGILSEARMGNYDAERDRMMQALGLQNTRDIAGQDYSARMASLGASNRNAADRLAFDQQALEAQERMFNRDLLRQGLNDQTSNQLAGMGLLQGALGIESGDRQFGLGTAADLANSFGNQQSGILAALPGLEEAGYYGLNQAYGASGQRDAANRAAAQARAAAMARDAERQFQYRIGAPNQFINDYLDQISRIAGFGGQTRSSRNTQGEEIRPGANVPVPSVFGNTLLGGLGGLLGGMGMSGGGGGGGSFL